MVVVLFDKGSEQINNEIKTKKFYLGDISIRNHHRGRK